MKIKNKAKGLGVRLTVVLLSVVLSACQLPPLPSAAEADKSLRSSAQESAQESAPADASQAVLDEAYHWRIDLGQLRRLEESNANYLIRADVPFFEKTELDALIRQKLTAEFDDFKKANESFKAEDPAFRAEFNVHCATYKIDERRFTLLFQTQRRDGGSAHPFVAYRVAYFDLDAERELGRNELLASGYLEALAAYSDAFFRSSETFKPLTEDELYREGIAAKPENYQNLIVKADGFELIFDRYQLFAGFMGEPVVSFGLAAVPALKILPVSPGGPSSYPSSSEAVQTTTEAGETSTESKAASGSTASSTESKAVSGSTALNAGTASVTSAPASEKPPQSGSKLIALSFDDGPYSPVDRVILDTLKSYGGRATFFMLGNRLTNYPDTVKRIHAEGHEIGNHSNTHPNLSELDAAAVKAELDAMDQALEKLIGQRSRIIRPTYGALSKTLRECAGRPLINWSVDTLDWKTRDADAVYNEIIKGAADGAIVLMHDLYPSTAEACAKAVPELVRQGYRFVTISELLAARSVNAQPGEVIYSCPR